MSGERQAQELSTGSLHVVHSSSQQQQHSNRKNLLTLSKMHGGGIFNQTHTGRTY